MGANEDTGELECAGGAELDSVGANHRRGIRTTLALVDELLCRVDQWARGYAARSALIDERNTLSDEQRARLLAVAGELRERIARAARDLNLEPETRDVAQLIWSECLALRVAVTELGAHYLRRYGEVTPELAAYADMLVQSLLDALARLSDVALGGPAHGCLTADANGPRGSVRTHEEDDRHARDPDPGASGDPC